MVSLHGHEPTVVSSPPPIWCGAARCAGVATAVEPKLRALQMQPGVRRHAQAREEARSDALLAMPEGMLVLDVNIVHVPAVAFLEGTMATGSSADVDGAAAAIGEKDKEDEYCRDIDGGAYEWVPVVMESGGRLGKGSMRVLNRLATIAAESDGVEKHVFVRPRARGAQCSACARQPVCVEAGVAGDGLWRRPLLPNWSRSAHRRSGLIMHADVMTSVSMASRLACSAP